MGLHGGVLEATSEGLGRGSTFFMELPLYFRDNNTPISTNDSIDAVSFSSIRFNLAHQNHFDEKKIPAAVGQNKPLSLLGSNKVTSLLDSDHQKDLVVSVDIRQKAQPEVNIHSTQNISTRLFQTVDLDVNRTPLVTIRSWCDGLRILVVDDSMPYRKVLTP